MRLLKLLVSRCVRGGFSSEFYWNSPEYVVPKSTGVGVVRNIQHNIIIKPFHINIYSPPTTNFALSSPIAQEFSRSVVLPEELILREQKKRGRDRGQKIYW